MLISTAARSVINILFEVDIRQSVESFTNIFVEKQMGPLRIMSWKS